MTDSDRLKILQQFAADDTTDPFNRYALALELTKVDKQKAKELFDELIISNSDYVPTYYQAALLSIELGLVHGATAIIELGIAQSKKQNNVKAANELRGLVDEI